MWGILLQHKIRVCDGERWNSKGVVVHERTSTDGVLQYLVYPRKETGNLAWKRRCRMTFLEQTENGTGSLVASVLDVLNECECGHEW